jgi:hypothetical protein
MTCHSSDKNLITWTYTIATLLLIAGAFVVRFAAPEQLTLALYYDCYEKNVAD